MEGKLLSIADVSRYLKTSKSTIYKLSQKGKIPSTKIGKQLRFRKSSIDNWLSSKEGAKILPASNSKNILLVDDDTLVLKTITKFLSQQGHNIECAGSGNEALKRLKKQTFDLVIIDVKMPEMDGIETIKRMRALTNKQAKPRIPEIVITGYMDTEAEREAGKIGITDFIYKPFVINDFIDIINKKSINVRK